MTAHHDDCRHVHPVFREPVREHQHPGGRTFPDPLTAEDAAALAPFADTVRRLRKARRLSQDAAAEAAGMSRRWWQYLEAAQRRPTLANVRDVAATLDPVIDRAPWTALAFAWWLDLAGLTDAAPHVLAEAIAGPNRIAAVLDREDLHHHAADADHADVLLEWADFRAGPLTPAS